RIRVRGAIHSIDPPGEDELRVLRRIGATSNVRLACHLRPRGAVEVTPLLPPFAHAADGRRHIDLAQGSEREIAILFADIRGLTAASEGRLPYDVVFVLNRYFAAIGRAVEAAGDASTSSLATASWRYLGSSAAPKPAAGRHSPLPGSYLRASTN